VTDRLSAFSILDSVTLAMASGRARAFKRTVCSQSLVSMVVIFTNLSIFQRLYSVAVSTWDSDIFGTSRDPGSIPGTTYIPSSGFFFVFGLIGVDGGNF
jgi:hypothetical protein